MRRRVVDAIDRLGAIALGLLVGAGIPTTVFVTVYLLDHGR